MNLFKPFRQSPDAADFDRDERKFYRGEPIEFQVAEEIDGVPVKRGNVLNREWLEKLAHKNLREVPR